MQSYNLSLKPFFMKCLHHSASIRQCNYPKYETKNKRTNAVARVAAVPQKRKEESGRRHPSVIRRQHILNLDAQT